MVKRGGEREREKENIQGGNISTGCNIRTTYFFLNNFFEKKIVQKKVHNCSYVAPCRNVTTLYNYSLPLFTVI